MVGTTIRATNLCYRGFYPLAEVCQMFTRAQLLKIARLTEPPDCSCKLKKQPFCTVPRNKGLPPTQGCELRRKAGDCECPYTFIPCPHVLAMTLPMAWEDWATLLRCAMPDEHCDDPPPPPEGHIAFDRETRVAVMRLRLQAGYSLWSEKDHVDIPRDIGMKAQRARNGSIVEQGVITQEGENRG